jgi:hypothetical protein
MTKYFDEIRKIINDYSRVKAEMDKLTQQVESIKLKKQDIELSLSQIREAEATLIDKIKIETGEEPDFYEIFQEVAKDARIPG